MLLRTSNLLKSCQKRKDLIEILSRFCIFLTDLYFIQMAMILRLTVEDSPIN